MEHFILLSDSQKQGLLKIASESIDYGLSNGEIMPINLVDYDQALQELGASFVTLELNGQLRGCIGSLSAYQPLILDVVTHAYDAAFRDPRFSPLTLAERAALVIKISMLTPAVKMTIKSEEDLLKQLRPSIDGLIIKDGGMQATFLPSVWEQLPDPKTFLLHLKHKAGMVSDHWSDTFEAYHYQVDEIR